MLPDISIQELDLFVKASRLTSLRELARQLELKPAHVSKVIKRLEGKIGHKLLQRSVAGIILTREGLDLLSVAEEICGLAEQLEGANSKRSKAEKDIVLSMGSISFLSTYLLAQSIQQIQKERKRARFRLIEFTHNELVSHGLNGAFEISVHIEPLQWTRTWASKRIGPLSWKLYSRKGHPLGKTPSESEILKYPFIVPTDWTNHGFSIGEDHCPVSWRKRLKGHEASTAETSIAIVGASDQLTFIPEVLARPNVLAGRLQEIQVENWPVVEKSIYLSVRADLISKPLMDTMLSVFKRNLSSHSNHDLPNTEDESSSTAASD